MATREYCKSAKTGDFGYYIKESEFNTEIQNLKLKAKEDLENLKNFAGKLYAENEFVVRGRENCLQRKNICLSQGSTELP